MRPGVVEDDFAVLVGLQVARSGGDELIAVPQRDMVWIPAPVGTDAAVIAALHRVAPRALGKIAGTLQKRFGAV